MTNLPPPPLVGAGGDPTNVMGRRIGAYAIDAAMGWVVFAITFLALSESTPSPFDPCGFDESPDLCFYTGDTVRFAEGGDATLIAVSGIAWWMVMGIVVQGLTGGTPGKLMTGLRVVSQSTGDLAGIGRCAARSAMWVADAFPFFFPLVGLITAIASKGHRRVGDMVAGTLVVAKESVGNRPVIPGVTAPPTGGWTSSAPEATPATFNPYVPGSAQGAIRPSGVAPFPEDPAVFARPPSATIPIADTAPPAQPGAPQWDEARNAWVLWEPSQARWLVHDTATGQWRPI